jgi:hypothetical protein
MRDSIAVDYKQIRHAGPDKPAPAIGKPGASRIHSAIFSGFRLLSASGGFAGMTSRSATMKKCASPEGEGFSILEGDTKG